MNTQECFFEIIRQCARLRIDAELVVSGPHPDPEEDEAGWTIGLLGAPDVFLEESWTRDTEGSLAGMVGTSLNDALNIFIAYIRQIDRYTPGGRLVRRNPTL